MTGVVVSTRRTMKPNMGYFPSCVGKRCHAMRPHLQPLTLFLSLRERGSHNSGRDRTSSPAGRGLGRGIADLTVNGRALCLGHAPEPRQRPAANAGQVRPPGLIGVVEACGYIDHMLHGELVGPR